MRKSIKRKILLGFVIVIAMLATAGGVSIYEFVRITDLVKSMIKDNYKTIQSGRVMLESLERRDSGVLLLLLGQYDEGSRILKSADSTFREAMEIAENNITEVDEEVYISAIKDSYTAYSNAINRAEIHDSTGLLAWYQLVVHKAFYEAKTRVNDLINLNQDAMFKESTQLEQQSRRAMMPGIVAICAALIFLLLLNFFISRYFVKPILKLIDHIHQHDNHHSNLRLTDIDSEDEIGELAKAIDGLIVKLRQ